MVMKDPVHPGEILREDVLADLGLSVGEAASRAGGFPGDVEQGAPRPCLGQPATWPCALRRRVSGRPARGWPCSPLYDLAAERASGRPTVRRLDSVA